MPITRLPYMIEGSFEGVRCGLQTKSQVLHHPVTVLAGITVGNFAFWADSLLVAVLLYYGANSFNRVAQVKGDNQLPYIFQARLLYPHLEK